MEPSGYVCLEYWGRAGAIVRSALFIEAMTSTRSLRSLYPDKANRVLALRLAMVFFLSADFDLTFAYLSSAAFTYPTSLLRSLVTSSNLLEGIEGTNPSRSLCAFDLPMLP